MFAWRETCRACWRQKPTAGTSQSGARRSKAGGVVDSLSKCDAAVWKAAKGALTASQQAEIEEKRRVVVEQPTAQSERKAARARSCRLVQARGPLPKAAQGSGGCVLLGGRNRRQSQGAEAAGAASVCGGSRVRKQRNLGLCRTRQRQPFLLPFPGIQARQRATWSWRAVRARVW